MNEWISVRNKLPEPDKKIIYIDEGIIMLGYYKFRAEDTGEHIFRAYDFYHVCNKNRFCRSSTPSVTYWMEIPEPPK